MQYHPQQARGRPAQPCWGCQSRSRGQWRALAEAAGTPPREKTHLAECIWVGRDPLPARNGNYKTISTSLKKFGKIVNTVIEFTTIQIKIHKTENYYYYPHVGPIRSCQTHLKIRLDRFVFLCVHTGLILSESTFFLLSNQTVPFMLFLQPNFLNKHFLLKWLYLSVIYAIVIWNEKSFIACALFLQKSILYLSFGLNLISKAVSKICSWSSCQLSVTSNLLFYT